MNFLRVLASLLGLLLIVGLAVAYASAAAGLVGWLDAGAVSLYALAGAGVAFLGAIGYYAVEDMEIKRRFRPAR